MNGRVYRVVGIILTVAMVAAITGCASSKGESTQVESVALVTGPPLLTEEQVKAQPAGSPERAALEWWFAVQQNDPELAATFYAEEPPVPALAGQFNLVGATLGGTVKIDSVKRSGKEATVVATQTISGAKPPSRDVTLRLARIGGTWKLTENLALDEAVKQAQGG
jgi:hypothetical protein